MTEISNSPRENQQTTTAKSGLCPMGGYPHNCVNVLGRYCGHCAERARNRPKIGDRIKAAHAAGEKAATARIIGWIEKRGRGWGASPTLRGRQPSPSYEPGGAQHVAWCEGHEAGWDDGTIDELARIEGIINVEFPGDLPINKDELLAALRNDHTTREERSHD